MNMFVVGYVTAAVTAAYFVNHHFLKVIIIDIGGYMPPLASTGCAAIYKEKNDLEISLFSGTR